MGGSLAYSLQLYFDFSGYSEMAIGLGLLFNYNLPLNFNLPYRATSIIDFWRRWHMTLSFFLKKYLYIPLGGNKNGNYIRNILITMFLCGLWHGAGWNFIFWGLLNGIFICFNYFWLKTEIRLPKIIGWILTFNAINLARIFFRADSFECAKNVIKAMFDIGGLVIPYSKGLYKYIDVFGHGKKMILSMSELGVIVLFLIISLIAINKQHIEKMNVYITGSLFAILIIITILSLGRVSEFLYFQF